MLTPNSLYPGARVALLCASSAVPEERLESALTAVKAMGLEPVVYPSCYYVNHHGYFAADDAQRAKELQDA
ncbi:MAG: LD-carboxypeptidase, partial [Oscillospiraceae bacterium]|nr:LD-carboxypeptidase [Oscillospiraceae bacterium]